MSLEKFTFEQPDPALDYSAPNDYIPETDKDKNWYGQYCRWIVSNFYNQTRQPFYSKDIVEAGYGIATECIRNWAYVFGQQPNNKFKYLQTDMAGNALPAVWIPGKKIAQLFNYLRGRLLEDISNITISAKNLSRDVASKRAEMYEKLLMKFELEPLMKAQMPEGVEFNPVEVDEPLESVEDIEKFTTKWQDKYSIMAEKIAQGQMYGDELKKKFLSVGADQLVGNLSAVLTEVQDGKVVNTRIPGYEIIWDNRQDDDYNSLAQLCGFVKHNVPYQEFVRRFKDSLSPEDIKEIYNLAKCDEAKVIDQFASFYNTQTRNGIQWWQNIGTNNMTITYSTVWWIAPRDWGYEKYSNRYGAKRYRKAKPDEKVTVSGDFSGYDIYTATIAGNKYILNYGLMNNVVRPVDDKSKPMLPMRIFCHNMSLGYGNSFVSMLRDDQDELDRLAYSIQQMTARAIGKVYFINGNKLDVTSTEMLSDLKIMGIHVRKGTSGEPDDPNEGQNTVETIDMTLDPKIMSFVELSIRLEQRMEEAASVSRIAMGQQQNTVGKGVQINTINQNSLGTASLMWGMMKHFEDVLQYNVNLKQMLYQFSDTVEESLTIGDEGSYLLRILNPREFGTQLLKVYIELNDILDATQKERIRAIAQADAQNGKIDTVDYIEHVELASSATQMVQGLKYSREKTRREQSRGMAAEQQAQMQHQADLQYNAKLMEAELLQLKEDNANWREVIKLLQKDVSEMRSIGMQQAQNVPPAPPESPLQAQLQAADEQQQQVQ